MELLGEPFHIMITQAHTPQVTGKWSGQPWPQDSVNSQKEDGHVDGARDQHGPKLSAETRGH